MNETAHSRTHKSKRLPFRLAAAFTTVQNRNPIVCTLTSRERAAQGDRWQQLLVRWNARIAIAEGGVTIRFDDAGARAELEDLVARERCCCKWMNLDLREEGRDLVLTVSAEGGADAIRELMAFGAAPVLGDPAD